MRLIFFPSTWFMHLSTTSGNAPSSAISVAPVRRKSWGVHLPPGSTSASTSLLRPLIGAPPGRCRSPTCLVTVFSHTESAKSGRPVLARTAGNSQGVRPVIARSRSICATVKSLSHIWCALPFLVSGSSQTRRGTSICSQRAPSTSPIRASVRVTPCTVTATSTNTPASVAR